MFYFAGALLMNIDFVSICLPLFNALINILGPIILYDYFLKIILKIGLLYQIALWKDNCPFPFTLGSTGSC